MTAAEDREKRAAITALVWRLGNRGDEDDEPFAQEFITALWGRGWRPIEGLRPAADWRLKTVATQPTERTATALEQARADAAAAAERFQARERGEVPPAEQDHEDRQEEAG